MLTVAAFMERALYDPEHGYYARAAQRSGRAGDFFTSVDVGPLFGTLIEVQLAEMAALLGGPHFDLVEAGAGNARLSADILCAARDAHPEFYRTIRLHLVEASDAARRAQRATLGEHADRLASSAGDLPDSFEGVLLANELLDAMPVHQVVMRDEGLREVYVDRGPERAAPRVDESTPRVDESAPRVDESTPRVDESAPRVDESAPHVNERAATDAREPAAPHLGLIEGPLSTPALQDYLDALGVTLQPGWRVEINLRAIDWIRDAARRLRRGFIVLIDYGHEARELYSIAHSAGTLTTFGGHRSAGPEAAAPAWLQGPGEHDITAHVDFTSVRAAAEAEGMQTIAFLDQTYFLLGLLSSIPNPQSIRNQSIPNPQSIRNPQSSLRNLKTLILPGGLGSTHKVLVLGKGVGTPALAGCSYRVRVT